MLRFNDQSSEWVLTMEDDGMALRIRKLRVLDTASDPQDSTIVQQGVQRQDVAVIGKG